MPSRHSHLWPGRTLLLGAAAACGSAGQGAGLGPADCRDASSSSSSSGPAEGLGVVNRMPWGTGSCRAGSKVGLDQTEGPSNPRSSASRLSRASPERSGHTWYQAPPRPSSPDSGLSQGWGNQGPKGLGLCSHRTLSAGNETSLWAGPPCLQDLQRGCKSSLAVLRTAEGPCLSEMTQVRRSWGTLTTA